VGSRRATGRVGLAIIAVVLVALASSHPSQFAPFLEWARLLASSDVGTMGAVSILGVLVVALGSLRLIRRAEVRQHDSETRLSRLLQSIDHGGDLITILNRDGGIEYANRAVEMTTGYSPQDLMGRRHERWLPWYAEDRSFQELRDALLTGHPFEGTVSCQRKDGTAFLLQEHVSPVEEGKGDAPAFVSTARDITRQKEIEDRLFQLARFDPLTAAPHRRHFVELLQEALAQPRGTDPGLAVLVMDLDRFKYVNDVFSPEVGDLMLRHVAEVLRALVGSRGIVGRLGSDEFGVVYRYGPAILDAGAFAETVLNALARDTSIGGQDIGTTVTIGVATSPRDGSDAATLLKNADIALSYARSFGRNAVRFFSQAMSDQVLELYSIQRRVAGAFRKGEYSVHYQPYCDLSTGRVSGAEALIRWNDGDHGFVPPSKFIPVLEDSGLILEVGEWVLRTACRQIGEWKGMHRAVPLAVNISHIQFGHRDLVGLVADAVHEHGINPRHLTLELTETICIHDLGFATELLGNLKRVGVSISVDDFGTGYSSLSYVKKLPVDNLKIDMSFVRDVTRDPDAASIITAITTMARGLGLKTIAEGVESEEQRNILHLLRCDMGQGYHFGRAAGADALERLLVPSPGDQPLA
jgi:diguanylate cyclase (GGDEF)-like protein/PAS domain S-box-containing protein